MGASNIYVSTALTGARFGMKSTRLFSALTGPVTSPPVFTANRFPYARGDLVEYVTHHGHRLAIIQRALPSDFGGRPAIVGVSREEGQRWLSPRAIHFHYPGYAAESLQTEEPDIPSCKAALDAFSDGALRGDIGSNGRCFHQFFI